MLRRKANVTSIQCALFFLIILCLFTLDTSCGPQSCKTALDCSGSQVCPLSGPNKGTCQPRPEGGREVAEEQPVYREDSTGPVEKPTGRDRGLSESGGADAGIVDTKPTPELPPGPSAGDLVINEVLADPPSGSAGDANQDGTRETSGDEFVEVVNKTSNPVDLSGVKLVIGGKAFAFPSGTVLPGEVAAVVFGGGMSSDTEVNTGKPHSKFGGALVFTKLPSSLLNSGTTIKLMSAEDVELDVFTYGAGDCVGNDQSVTRSPDGVGPCVSHSKADPKGSVFSPGTRADGSSFRDPLPEPPPSEGAKESAGDAGSGDAGVTESATENAPTESSPTERLPEASGQTPASGDLVVNELHTDPDSSKGDANKDGTVSSKFDEFIEIVNVSGKVLNMTGVEVHVSTSSKVKVFTFGGLSLGPREVVVLFAGGNLQGEVGTGKPNSVFGCPGGKNVYVYKYQASKALSNGGGTVTLELAGSLLTSFQYGAKGCEGDKNQSVTRSPDLTGSCALHSVADVNTKTLFSPGRQLDGTCF